MAKMGPCNNASAAHPILISAVFLLSSIVTTYAFNITRILNKHPEYSQFNSLLTKTQLADEINSRRTITVLAISNYNIGDLSGKSEDVQKRVLSNHVVLDYYDGMKLSKLKEKKTVLTTLYQATGTADERQGFLNVVHKDGNVVFGSATKGSALDAKLEGSVSSQPYNISVLSISQPIIAFGIDGSWRSAPAPKNAASPADSASQAPSPDESRADAPASTEAPAPAPADGPTADGPAPADTPTADAPNADAPAVDQFPESDSASVKQMPSGVSLGLTVGLASILGALF